MLTPNTSLNTIHDAISRDIRVFVGGFIEAMVIYIFANFVLEHFFLIDKLGQLTIHSSFVNQDEFFAFVFLLILSIVLPLILSFILSQRLPRLKITSAFQISIIAVVVAMFILITQSKVTPNNSMYFISALLYLPMIALLEDRIITFFTGKEMNESFIYFEHRLIYSPIEEVKGRLNSKDARSALLLCTSNSEDNSIIFETKKSARIFPAVQVLKIRISENSDAPENTDLKIVYYQLGLYGMRDSPKLTQEVYKTSGFLTNLLRRYTPPLDFSIVTDVMKASELKQPEPILSSVATEMQGFYSRNRQISWFDWARYISIVIMLFLSPALFLSELPTYGAIVAGFDVLA
jgi:hypothetical protein